MNVAQAIIKSNLTTIGASYRPLPLLTMSAVGEGYAERIRKTSGMTYGIVGAIGDRRGLHTMYNVPQVVAMIAKKLKCNPRWASQARLVARRMCLEFQKLLNVHAGFSKTNPKKFFHFVIRHYPTYMAGIGVYNLFWRYIEFATPGMPGFGKVNLQTLADERNELAKIYPRCEVLMRESAGILGKAFGVRGDLLLMMTSGEMRKTLRKGKASISMNNLLRRQHGYIFIRMNGKEYIDSNAGSVHRIRRYITSLLQIKKYGKIKGTPVSPGRVTGTVIKKIKRASWPRNPIFVTPMTHPKDIPYLKRIKGLITDEGGGILSHAAIVARELHIPCVIATRLATKLLKEGDTVRVNATTGIVTVQRK